PTVPIRQRRRELLPASTCFFHSQSARWQLTATHYVASLARLASQSRLMVLPSRSNVDLPLIVSPSSFPSYFVTNFCPLRSRVTLNDTVPSLNEASSIGVS